jgi:putative membrane protein
VSSLFAFLHHAAAFTLVAALAVEFVLLRGTLTLSTARQIRVADLVYGISAMLVLVIGMLRAAHFEKGPAYYSHSVPFIAKVTLFIVIALLSIYPTVEFLRWKGALRRGEAPAVPEAKLRRIRALVHWELALIALLVLCAALMARGVGYLG